MVTVEPGTAVNIQWFGGAYSGMAFIELILMLFSFGRFILNINIFLKMISPGFGAGADMKLSMAALPQLRFVHESHQCGGAVVACEAAYIHTRCKAVWQRQGGGCSI